MTRRLITTCLALAALLVPALRIVPVVHADARSHITSGGLSGYHQTIGATAPAAKSADPPAPTRSETLHPVFGSSYAGTWSMYIHITCLRSGASANLCDLILGPSGITNFQNGITTHCNASGSYCHYTGFFTAYNNAPGYPYLCSNDVFVIPYIGVCSETERGTLDVVPGALGLPDFFITTEYASYATNPPTTNVFDPAGVSSYPLDTLFPAVPGTYDTGWILRHLGLIGPSDGVPAGISLNMTVQHLTDWQ